LRHLLDETSDLIESPFFTRILTSLNNEGFSTLIDQKCAEFAFRSSAASQPPKATPQDFSSSATIVPVPSGPKAKLATVLAVMTREAHSIGNGTTPPNEYLVAMEQGVRELEAFAAVVYSSNFDLEMPHSGLDNGLAGSTPLFSSGIVLDHVDAGDLDRARVADSLVDLGSSSRVREAAGVAEENVQGPTEALASGAPTDPAFEKVWGQALENSGAEKQDSSKGS
jgi:peroxin-3